MVMVMHAPKKLGLFCTWVKQSTSKSAWALFLVTCLVICLIRIVRLFGFEERASKRKQESRSTAKRTLPQQRRIPEYLRLRAAYPSSAVRLSALIEDITITASTVIASKHRV